jgi:disulfide bond formation protein DsbB
MAKQTAPAFIPFLSKYYLYFGFLITSAGTVGSLFLSEVLKLPPCDLCWFQRAFMYPQMVIFGFALWKNDRSVVQYILPLSVIGLLVGLYHNMLQLNPTVLPCTSSTVSCATKQIEIYGVDAIPVMSVLVYLMLVVLSLIVKKYSK